MKRPANAAALLVAVLTLTLASSAARADDVPPPPDDCPAGSEGRTSHQGPACYPTTCAADADCKSPKRCAPQALCTKTETVTGGRRNTPVTRTIVVATCGAGGSCPAGRRARRRSGA